MSFLKNDEGKSLVIFRNHYLAYHRRFRYFFATEKKHQITFDLVVNSGEINVILTNKSKNIVETFSNLQTNRYHFDLIPGDKYTLLIYAKKHIGKYRIYF